MISLLFVHPETRIKHASQSPALTAEIIEARSSPALCLIVFRRKATVFSDIGIIRTQIPALLRKLNISSVIDNNHGVKSDAQ